MSYPDPRYLGDGGEISAVYHDSKQHEPDLIIGTRASVHYLARGTSTHEQFGLYKWELKSNTQGTTPHFHRTMSESFFILSGRVRLFDGNRWIDATPGDFLYVPEGGIHSFGNDSGEPASMLILFAPGAPREGYFQALAEIAAGRQFTDEEFAEICMRHDNYFLDEKSQALYKKLTKNR
jgi:mannose-6-phosphate isomerase-like protein (cupin superfamily)